MFSMTSTPPRILIVDDDKSVLATVPKILKHYGYIVSEAKNGIEAIAQCEKHLPHLAILDISMPGINGIETARKIQENTATPFIFFSACDNKETIEEAVEHGALGYLVKPINIEQMIPTIETALRRAKDFYALHDKKEKLIDALNRNRITSTAVGILMERHHLTQDAAFELLRGQARKRREKIEKISAQLITASDMLNNKNPRI